MSAEPTTIRERYSRAMSSSHLELSSNRRGDIDIIMAAGAAGMPDERRDESTRTGYSALPIGMLLMRLMEEYDEARGPRAVARRNFEAGMRSENVREQATQAVARENGMRHRRGEKEMTPSELQACMVKAADEMRDRLAHEAKMAHMFVLIQLKSLETTKREFSEWAMRLAVRRRFMDVGPLPIVDPEQSSLVAAWRKGKKAQQTVVLALAGQVLDLLLDPICFRCEGRGSRGGYSNASICTNERKGGCGGSGYRRTDRLGNCKEQHDFAAYLMMEVDILLGRSTREMKEKLRDAPESTAVA